MKGVASFRRSDAGVIFLEDSVYQESVRSNHLVRL